MIKYHETNKYISSSSLNILLISQLTLYFEIFLEIKNNYLNDKIMIENVIILIKSLKYQLNVIISNLFVI
jgi:hypothetical protein